MTDSERHIEIPGFPWDQLPLVAEDIALPSSGLPAQPRLLIPSKLPHW